MIEVRVGVADHPKELVLELEDEIETIRKAVDTAISDQSTLWLTDKKGRQTGVPFSKVAYVEISPNVGPRPVGFSR